MNNTLLEPYDINKKNLSSIIMLGKTNLKLAYYLLKKTAHYSDSGYIYISSL